MNKRRDGHDNWYMLDLPTRKRLMGGHARVGLEDAIYYDWNTKRLATNAGLIERVVRLARAAGREIATAEETRKIIGIPTTVATTVRLAG